MARIQVGPVVGLVTETTARILIETDSDAALRMDVVVAGTNRVVATHEIRTRANRASTFEIDQLEVGTTYTVGFDVDDRARHEATVRPIDGNRLQAAVVSCSDASLDLLPKAWEGLGKRVAAGQVDLILHAGNQIYADQVFRAWVDRLRGQDAGAWAAASDDIREDYRRLYRTAWNRPFLRACLARAANLMIWDEHDIAAGWGDRAELADPTRPEHHVACMGWEVYREYQRQLWDADALVRPYPHEAGGGVTELTCQRWGRMGLLMVDVRGGRGFRQLDREALEPADGDLPYLSPQQWQAIDEALSAGGALADVQALVVVTPTPVVFIGHRQVKDHLIRAPFGISEKAGNLTDDIRGTWGYGQYRHEQTRLLDRLHAWKQGAADREALIVSGSVGVGGTWDVLDSESRDVLLRQVIASPVHRPPENWMKFRLVAGHLQRPNMDRERVTEPPRYRWLAREVHRQQNLAYVSIDTSLPQDEVIDSHLDLFA